MFIRKFFDIEAAEAPASAPTEIVQAEAPEAPSVASLMAKSGIINTTDTLAATPIEDKQEISKQPETTEPKSVAPTKEAEEKKEVAESQAVVAEPKKEETPAIVEPKPEAVQQTLQEVLKSQQPEAVLKELGFDDKMVAFLNHWKSGGDLNAYLKEMTTDYATMPPEEVMRHQLRREYPKAQGRALEILYNKKVVEAYKLDPDTYSEDEVEEGKLLLEAEAEKYRDELTENQQKFLLPKPPEKSSANDEATQTARIEAEAEQKRISDLHISTFSSDPATQALLSKKAIIIGEGDTAFTYPADPDAISKTLLDYDFYRNLMFDVKKDEKGRDMSTPKVKHQLLVAGVALYGQDFLDRYAKHWKAIGGKSTVEPIENASKENAGQQSQVKQMPATAAEAMARGGRLVN